MTRYILLAVSGFVLLPLFVVAEYSPFSQVVITTQVAAGVAQPATNPLVIVTATGPSLSGVPNTSSPVVSFPATFGGDTHTVTFVPGSYETNVQPPTGYYVRYSPDCSGFTSLYGSVKYCTVTLTTTPPPSTACTYWDGTAYTCGVPYVQYVGPMGQVPLSCTPEMQTVGMGQPVTFTAFGGTPGGYNWVTSDRTSQNIGPKFTTVLQSAGVQNVTVSNGVQTAVCTVNVVTGSTAASYIAPVVIAPGAVSPVQLTQAPVVVSHVPRLPNTGFAPVDGATVAIALTIVFMLGVFFYPYVRKALTVVA